MARFTNLIRVATKVHLTLCAVAVIFFSVPNYWQFCDFLVRTTIWVLFQNGVCFCSPPSIPLRRSLEYARLRLNKYCITPSTGRRLLVMKTCKFPYDYLNVLTVIVGLQTTQWENANNAANCRHAAEHVGTTLEADESKKVTIKINK